MAMLEGGEVAGFVVGHAVVPAAPEDADPLEGERPQDRLVVLARPLLLAVVGLGPRTFGHGLAGPFHEGLAQEDRGVPAPVDPELMTTLHFDRGDAGILLQAGRIGIAGPIRPEGDEQPRRQRRAGPRQAAEEPRLRMRGEASGDLGLDLFDPPKRGGRVSQA